MVELIVGSCPLAAAPPEARHAVELTRLDEGKAVTGTVRKQSRERARAVAKRLGLTA